MTINTAEFETKVETLALALTSFERPLKQWGIWMVGSVKRNFAEEGRPERWAPLKVNTLLARYLRTAAAKKLSAAGGERARFAANPAVYSDKGKGAAALSTVAGFRRSTRNGKVLRSRHGGLNKVAKDGMMFRAAAAKAVLQGKILQDRGLLRGSLSTGSAVKAGARSVSVGTAVKYAAVHQFGSAKKKIPARPFLVIQDDDRAEFADLLKRHLRGEGL
jgi:phage gpG-like protein